MAGFIIRRLLIAIPVLIGISIVTFVFANLAPGDPISSLIRPGADIKPGQLEAIKEALGLNQPWHIRYLTWLSQLLQGNLGATTQGTSVGQLIGFRLPNTIKLMGTALAISLVLGVSLGVLSAFRRGSKLDHILTVGVFLGISLPSYLVALFAIFIFAVTIHNATGFLLFPAGGDRDINSNIPDWLDQLWHLILPASVLSFLLTATFMRYTRASVIEVMGQDYVVAARSKGLSERTVRLDHVLRSALIPIVTVTALTLPALVTGAFFVETLFAWPGIGLLGVQSIQTHQYNIIMGVAMLTAVAIVISNLLADVLYAFVDPRIRYS